jgi:hypothetical protein
MLSSTLVRSNVFTELITVDADLTDVRQLAPFHTTHDAFGVLSHLPFKHGKYSIDLDDMVVNT